MENITKRFNCRLHVRFCVQFPAQHGLQLTFQQIALKFPVAIAVGKIIKIINPLYANCARNRTENHTQNRTRIDAPSQLLISL
jgi:hypothetical protein